MQKKKKKKMTPEIWGVTLCCDPSRPVSAPNPIATQRFCRNTGANKTMSRPKPPSMPENSVRTWNQKALSRTPKQGRVCTKALSPCSTLPTLSRHRKPCRDTAQNKLCRDKGPKMGNSPPWPSYTSCFLFLSFLDTLNSLHNCPFSTRAT